MTSCPGLPLAGRGGIMRRCCGETARYQDRARRTYLTNAKTRSYSESREGSAAVGRAPVMACRPRSEAAAGRPPPGVVVSDLPSGTYAPAALRMASALSVRSHVKPSPSRPKWPWRAVST